MQGDRLMAALATQETILEDIQSSQRLIADLNAKKESNQKAMRCMQKTPPTPPPQRASKQWVAVGDLFVRMDQQAAVDLMRQDQEQMDAAIDVARANIANLTKQLNSLKETMVS